MDANRWLLGLVLAFEMQVRQETESIRFDAERLCEALDKDEREDVALAVEEALKGVRYIQRQCETLLRLRDLGPTDATLSHHVR